MGITIRTLRGRVNLIVSFIAVYSAIWGCTVYCIVVKTAIYVRLVSYYLNIVRASLAINIVGNTIIIDCTNVNVVIARTTIYFVYFAGFIIPILNLIISISSLHLVVSSVAI